MNAGGEEQQQRLLLRWHRHAPTITDQLPHMFEEGLFTDVTLSINGEHLRAHRLILASCSRYFLQLFQSGLFLDTPSLLAFLQEADRTNVEHPFVILLNANVEDVRAILSFMYKGECCVCKDRIPHLLSTARNLKVSGLSDMEVDATLEHPKEKRPSPPPLLHTELSNIAELLINDTESAANNGSAAKMQRDVPETCKCFVCGKYLSNQYNLRVHMETHEETYHACSSCPHVSRSRDALRKHMSYRHPDKYNTRKQKKLSFV